MISLQGLALFVLLIAAEYAHPPSVDTFTLVTKITLNSFLTLTRTIKSEEGWFGFNARTVERV